MCVWLYIDLRQKAKVGDPPSLSVCVLHTHRSPYTALSRFFERPGVALCVCVCMKDGSKSREERERGGERGEEREGEREGESPISEKGGAKKPGLCVVKIFSELNCRLEVVFDRGV